MLRLLGTLARMIFGLTLASLAAGLVIVLFVDIDGLGGPPDGLPRTLADTIDLALLAATHIAIFASLFVLIAGVIGEWFSIRTLSFYLLGGIVVALLGFTAQYMSEVAGQPTILNNYAVRAFLTVGFFGGFVYWLGAGQFAGSTPGEPPARSPAATVTGASASSTEKSNPATEVVITKPPTADDRPRWRMPRLERLKFASRQAREQEATGSERTSAADETNP